jgi:hypothetical protein
MQAPVGKIRAFYRHFLRPGTRQSSKDKKQKEKRRDGIFPFAF